MSVRKDWRRTDARTVVKAVLAVMFALILLGLGTWHLPNLPKLHNLNLQTFTSSEKRLQFLYVIPTPTEGIGSIAILGRRCGYLAVQAKGKMVLPEYYTVSHHYSISDALPDTPSLVGTYDGQLCLLSEHTTFDEFQTATNKYNGTINTTLDSIITSLKAQTCSVVVCDFPGDNNHGDMDVMTTLYGRYSDCKRESGLERINIHIRWGDAGGATNAADYGRQKSADVAAARRYIDAVRAKGMKTKVQIYTQKDPDGNLPPLPDLANIEHSFVLEGDVRTTLHGLGDCDTLFTGGSQMAILASAIACAPTIVFPDSQIDYFEDSLEFGVRYVPASSIM